MSAGTSRDWRPTAAQAAACRIAAAQWGREREDCQQEALIAIWRAGKVGADARMHRVARGGVIAYLRKWLGREKGSAKREATSLPWDADQDAREDLDTPEAILSASQWAALYERAQP